MVLSLLDRTPNNIFIGYHIFPKEREVFWKHPYFFVILSYIIKYYDIFHQKFLNFAFITSEGRIRIDHTEKKNIYIDFKLLFTFYVNKKKMLT